MGMTLRGRKPIVNIKKTWREKKTALDGEKITNTRN
jgi:hypothetical protein